MTGNGNPAHSVASVVHALALAAWAGGAVLYTFVLTPAIFAAYPRDQAGGIVGTMMPHYFRFEFGAVLVAAASLMALWRRRPPRLRALSLALLIGALAAQAFVQWGLYPRILEAKSRVASFESAPDAPERRRFRSLHGVSMAVNLALLVDGILLIALADRAGAGPGLPKKE